MLEAEIENLKGIMIKTKTLQIQEIDIEAQRLNLILEK